MPIRYAAVFEGNSRVCEYPQAGFPNLAQICQKLADKECEINKYNRAKLSDDAQGVDVCYLATGKNVLIACVSTQDVAIRISFDMLARIESKCRGDRAAWGNPVMTLKNEVAYANDPANDLAKNVQGQISEIQDIMMDNMDKMLDRHDKLEGMVQQSDALASEGQKFQKKAKTLKRKMCLQHAKTTAMMVCVGLVLVMIILFIVCKPNFSDCS